MFSHVPCSLMIQHTLPRIVLRMPSFVSCREQSAVPLTIELRQLRTQYLYLGVFVMWITGPKVPLPYLKKIGNVGDAIQKCILTSRSTAKTLIVHWRFSFPFGRLLISLVTSTSEVPLEWQYFRLQFCLFINQLMSSTKYTWEKRCRCFHLTIHASVEWLVLIHLSLGIQSECVASTYYFQWFTFNIIGLTSFRYWPPYGSEKFSKLLLSDSSLSSIRRTYEGPPFVVTISFTFKVFFNRWTWGRSRHIVLWLQFVGVCYRLNCWLFTLYSQRGTDHVTNLVIVLPTSILHHFFGKTETCFKAEAKVSAV